VILLAVPALVGASPAPNSGSTGQQSSGDNSKAIPSQGDGTSEGDGATTATPDSTGGSDDASESHPTVDETGTDSTDTGNDTKDAPKPELGHSVVADPGEGTVRVRTPGSSSWHAADATDSLPVGSVVDATHGHVTLHTAIDAQGGSQTGTFWGGRFEVRQASHGVTELVLRGPRPRCGQAGTAVASANKTTGLWGHDNHGKFRTRGHNSVASVRGTTWYVGERCGGTYTRVTSGVVLVRDIGSHRTVVLHAGQSHLARSRG
jgi:hypothetical protein